MPWKKRQGGSPLLLNSYEISTQHWSSSSYVADGIERKTLNGMGIEINGHSILDTGHTE